MTKLIMYCYKKIQHILFYRVISNTSKTILLLDIDNTLANTWPTINQSWNSESERLLKLKSFESVIANIFENYSPKNYQWVFLSSRSYFLHYVTICWLKRNKMPAGWKNVILVQSPMEKIDLINKYVKSKIVYFDDLSYNHENGVVKFYEKEIELIKINDNVEYHGYEQILKIIKNYE